MILDSSELDKKLNQAAHLLMTTHGEVSDAQIANQIITANLLPSFYVYVGKY